MKITFPHMGNLNITAKALFSALGQEVIDPPPCTKKTLALGNQHSPEGVCLPFKINMGNFLEAAELGADTIVLTGGCGPCRFGYYGEVQREILHDLGYKYDLVVLEAEKNSKGQGLIEKIKFLGNGKSYLDIMAALRIAWHKTKAVDAVEMEVQRMRAHEAVQGTCDKIYNHALKRIDKAENVKVISAVVAISLEEIRKIKTRIHADIIRIGLIGEIYTIIEPFANLNIERHLGKLGAEVRRSLYLSQWANDHLFGGILQAQTRRTFIKKAQSYLPYDIGGHAKETIGSAAYFAEQNYDGIIQVAPLTCMPEIIGQAILPYLASDKNIPFMTLYVDGQSGEAGLITRLEAFCDLVRQRKKSKLKESV